MTSRGRLSSVDLLPDWADEARLKAFTELRDRKRTQLDILDEFNTSLRQRALLEGITDPPQISRTAFNLRSIRLDRARRRQEEVRDLARELAPKFEDGDDHTLTLFVAETIKTLATEMLENAGQLSADGATAEMLMMTSRALKHAEEAKKISAETRSRMERELRDKSQKTVEAVVSKRGGGMTTDVIGALTKALSAIPT